MSREQRDTLKKLLDKNYTDYIAALQGKTAAELIAMASEIAAARQLHEELLGACDDDAMEFLLHFNDPLDLVLGSWESEIINYDHSEEMGHMLWRIREDGPYDFERQETEPVSRDEIAIDPVSAVRRIATDDLRKMEGQEGLVLQGCGGDLRERGPQKPRMRLVGEDGNIFAILGRASGLLNDAGMKEQSDEMFRRVTACDDYAKALRIISEYVETEMSPHSNPQKSTKKKARNMNER